ncbi:Rha family transcriptional regulator [Paenisporosarcina sp. OV554]|uniref:Rha family transcriptional regulator n=1 Tax=Paenisporosarcina sp. OV554 TaxID=2135694 RepID=UPI000D3BC678|nr:Rha family transcriptional regulator [Paenisporosarcina sp. OV554]PUB12587.1 Rha family phage regulatory protein [Paenisporosarcina sp. OV554]
MNQLKVISINGQLITDSRDVAEMVEKRHTDLMRTISGYVETLENAKLRSQDFFIPNTYKTEGNNKTYDCFLLTKKGCDMVANKMTGEKGVLFTAAYVTQFEVMEKTVNQPRALTGREQLEASMKLSLMTSEDVKELKGEVVEIRGMVENQITLDHGEQRRLQKLISSKVFEFAKSDDHRRFLYPELYREIKDRFGVASYKDVKRHELQLAIKYVESWIPRKGGKLA